MRRLLLSVLICSCVAAVTATTAAAATGLKTVRYGAYAVHVPRSWPVFELASDPSACVRFDRHAVYLGRPSANQRCPAHAVGRTEALLVEPLAAVAASSGAGAAPVLPAARSARAQGSVGELVVPSRGVVVTATWARDPGMVDRALGVRSIPPQPAESTGSSAAPGAPTADGARRADAEDAGGARRADAEDAGGLGFDTCSAPSPSAMAAWLQSSPFRAAAIYIGGANSACTQPNLSAAWVSAEATAGWQFIPVYVGLQSPTSSCGCAQIVPARATAEGSAAASDAIAQAQALGIGTGNPIYFDMEAYTRTTKSTSAVLAFLSAWTSVLDAAGYTSGIYSSAASGITDLVDSLGTSFAEPADIWIADWNNEATVNDPYVPAGDWVFNQRLHQYQGGHIDSFGGVRLDIDSDYLDGATATPGVGSIGEGALPNGTFVSFRGKTYRLAGGAPTYVHSWADFGGPQPTVALVAAQWAALSLVPANGTFIQATTTGTVYRIAGGAPVSVPSWSTFGGAQPTVTIDDWDLRHITNPATHMNAVPLAGTTVEGLPSGLYWLFASGLRAPTAASSSAVGVPDAGLASFPEAPVGHASLSGVATRTPKLRVWATSAVNAPELRTFTIVVPPGLRFSRSAANIATGVVVWGSNGRPLAATAKLSHGKLIVALRSAARHVLVSTYSPAIVATNALVAAVRARTAPTLAVVLAATDAEQETTVLPFAVRP